MAGEFQPYSNGYVLIDGKLIIQETSMTLEKKSGLNPVFTVAGGFSGMSQGATTCEVTIENAVPSADFEFNPDAYMRTGTVVEIGILMAGRATTMRGYITEASYSHSVNQESKLSMKAMCKFADFE